MNKRIRSHCISNLKSIVAGMSCDTLLSLHLKSNAALIRYNRIIDNLHLIAAAVSIPFTHPPPPPPPIVCYERRRRQKTGASRNQECEPVDNTGHDFRLLSSPQPAASLSATLH